MPRTLDSMPHTRSIYSSNDKASSVAAAVNGQNNRDEQPHARGISIGGCSRGALCLVLCVAIGLLAAFPKTTGVVVMATVAALLPRYCSPGLVVILYLFMGCVVMFPKITLGIMIAPFAFHFVRYWAQYVWIHLSWKWECLASRRRAEQNPDLWKAHPPTEECPICLIPLPLEQKDLSYYACCGKLLCRSCVREHIRAQYILKKSTRKRSTCPFCRQKIPYKDSRNIMLYEERARRGDATAMVSLSIFYWEGSLGLNRDEAKALHLLECAAEKGSARALLTLGDMYYSGGVETPKNTRKGEKYYEMAATKGSVGAHVFLGRLADKRGHRNLVVRHLRLAAEAGSVEAVEFLKVYLDKNVLAEDVFDDIVKTHKKAYGKMMSVERDRITACEAAQRGDDKTLAQVYGSYYSGDITAEGLVVALKANHDGVWNIKELDRAILTNQARFSTP